MSFLVPSSVVELSLSNFVGAAGVPGAAFEEALEGEPAGVAKAFLTEGFGGVVGAGGVEAAAVAKVGADAQLIGTDEEEGDVPHKMPKTSLSRVRSTSITIRQIMIHSSRLECWWLSSLPIISKSSRTMLRREFSTSTRLLISR